MGTPESAPNVSQRKKGNNGTFKPGHDPRRPVNPRADRPNHLTRDLRKGIVDAAIKHGSDGKGRDGLTGYCFHLAKKHPKAFAGLMSKVLPMEVTGAIGHYIGQVNIVAVPADHYLSPADIEKLAAPGLLELEATEQHAAAAAGATDGTADNGQASSDNGE